MIVNIIEDGNKVDTAVGRCEVLDASLVRWPRSGKIYIQYLYADLLNSLVEDMHTNVRNSYDNLVVITGPEGSGKSNLAYAVCKAYDPDFSITNQYVYDTKDFHEMLRDGQDLRGTFWMDEGSNMANNRDWNTTDNKQLVQLLEMCRSRNWTLVLCIPSLDRLDLYIREYRVRYWIECKAMKFDKYGMKERGYFELRKRTPYGKMKSVGYGLYEPMPPEAKGEYEKLKLESQNKKIKSVVEPDKKGSYESKYKESQNKINDIMLALHDSGTPKDSLMQMFGIDSDQTYYNRLTKARKARNHDN